MSAAAPPLRLAILISGRGSNMMAIARACLERRIRAEVAVVIADQDGAYGITAARGLGLATCVVPVRAFPDRAAFERELRAALAAHPCDAIALAGFMRILSAEFAEEHLGRTLNIHPSLLPKYRGLHTHRRALEAGDREHGASVHFVTAELDGGPVILQSRIAIRPGDGEAELSARVQRTEHIIYPKVIGWMADGRLAWRQGRAWLDGKPLDEPMVEDFRDEAAF